MMPVSPDAAVADDERVVPPAREVALSSREVLERVMLQLSRLPAKVDRGPVVAAMGRTLAALGQLVPSEIDDPDHLDLLRAAAEASGLAHGEMSKAEGASDGGLTKSLAGVFDALSGRVEPTIQLVVSRQDKQFRRRGEAPPRKPDLVVFQVCAGAPRLFTFERKPLPLPLLLRVAPLPSAARAEEADELEKDAADDDVADDDAADEGARAAGELRGAGESREAGQSGRTGEGPSERTGEGPSDAGDAGASEPADEGGTLDREVWDGWDEGGVTTPQEAEVRALRGLARDAAEEVGSLGLLRVPASSLPNTAWAIGPASFEARLLENLDAFMALAEPYAGAGGAARFDPLSPLLDWAGDAMVPDPARAFARAFVLGSVAGEDTAAAAVMSLRQSHTLTYEAQRDALSLAPHPGIAPLVERMIAEESPELVRVGLSILERRRQAAFEVVAPLLSHPSALVRAAAARCLGAATAPQAARSLLLQHAATEEDDAALAATAESLLLLGSRRGLDLIRDKLGEEAAFPGSLPRAVRADLLRLLAIAGGQSDSDLLSSLLGHDPLAATSLGFFGDATLVPAMLSALAASVGLPSRWAFACALARALHRITGLGRTAMTDPERPTPLVDPPVSAEFWARAWAEKHETFAARRKYRFGSPFSPVQSVDEADTPELPAVVRRDLLIEIAIASRGQSRVHAEDWVARQKAALAEMREVFRRGAGGSYPDGQWLRTALFE